MKTLLDLSSGLGNNHFNLRVEDAHSGDTILNIEMSLEDLGKLVTGKNITIKGDMYQQANIAKKRVVHKVNVEKVFDKDEQKSIVVQDFEERFKGEGWELFDTGITTQQPNKHHTYTIVKYEVVDNPLEKESRW